MRYFNPFRRRFTAKEHRLIFGVDGGAEDMGGIEFDTGAYNTENLPRGYVDEEGKGMKERVEEKYGKSGERTQSFTREDMKRAMDEVIDNAMRLKKIDTDIEQDLNINYGELLDEVTNHIWKMPDMQRGVAKLNDAIQRGWNYFWDLVKVNRALPMNHPLVKNMRAWKNGTKLPGIYYKGKLAKLSSSLLGPYSQGGLSGEYKRFDKVKKPEEQFDRQVPARFRGRVQAETAEALDLPEPNSLTGRNVFDSLQWNQIKPGDDERKLPHIFRMHKPGGAVDDAAQYLPGEEPFNGLVFVYGDQEVPAESEVLYVDFKQTNEVLWYVKQDPVFKKLLTTEGFYSGGQTNLYENLLREFPANKADLDTLGLDFYQGHPEIGRIHKDKASLMYIVDTLKHCDIEGADLEWLSDGAATNKERAAKMKKLVEAVKTGAQGNRELWKRALTTYCPGYKAEKGEDWFAEFLSQFDEQEAEEEK